MAAGYGTSNVKRTNDPPPDPSAPHAPATDTKSFASAGLTLGPHGYGPTPPNPAPTDVLGQQIQNALQPYYQMTQQFMGNLLSNPFASMEPSSIANIQAQTNPKIWGDFQTQNAAAMSAGQNAPAASIINELMSLLQRSMFYTQPGQNSTALGAPSQYGPGIASLINPALAASSGSAAGGLQQLLNPGGGQGTAPTHPPGT